MTIISNLKNPARMWIRRDKTQLGKTYINEKGAYCLRTQDGFVCIETGYTFTMGDLEDFSSKAMFGKVPPHEILTLTGN